MLSIILFASLLCFVIACPPNTHYIKDTDICLYVDIQGRDFNSAETLCASMGGHLVSIHNGFTNSFVAGWAHSMLNGQADQVLLGAHRPDSKTHFYSWTDGTTYNYNHWQPGHPMGDNNCVYLNTSYMNWYSTDCATKMPVACSLPNVTATTGTGTAPTSTSTTTTPTSCGIIQSQVAIAFESTQYNDFTPVQAFINRMFTEDNLWPDNPTVALLPFPGTDRYDTTLTNFKTSSKIQILKDVQSLYQTQYFAAGLPIDLSSATALLEDDDALPGMQKALVIIGNNDTEVTSDAEYNANELKDSGFLILTVSIGSPVVDFKTIPSSPDYTFNWDSNAATLGAVIKQLNQALVHLDCTTERKRFSDKRIKRLPSNLLRKQMRTLEKYQRATK